MYEDWAGDDSLTGLDRGQHDPALFHRGDYTRLLRQHRRDVEYLRDPDCQLDIHPLLMRRIADPRMMRTAMDALAARGPRAPGPDGIRLEDLDSCERWAVCRLLAESVRDSSYRPGPSRSVTIPKPLGRGFRTLTMQNFADRVVARALVEVLEPLVDEKFSPFSFGFRRGLGPRGALATALAYTEREQAFFWVSADVANAFDVIPHGRFLDACGRHFRPDVVRFMDTVSSMGTSRGLRQGSPASPFFCNIYFDHFLDRQWHRRHSGWPLFRYADDLLVACHDQHQASIAAQELTRLARSAGTPLKSMPAIVDIRNVAVPWLGYTISMVGGEFAIHIDESAWQALTDRLQQAHSHPRAPLRAEQIIRGWLGYLAPCYLSENPWAVVMRLRATAAAQSFDEISSATKLLRMWRKMSRQWLPARERSRLSLPDRLSAICSQEDSR